MLNHKIGSRLTFLGKRWTLTKVDSDNWYITDSDNYESAYSLEDSGWRKEGNSSVIWDPARKPMIIIG